MGDAARSGLPKAVRIHGGLERISTRSSKRKPRIIRIEVKAVLTTHAKPSALDEYELKIFPPSGPRAAQFAHSEELKFKRSSRQGRRIRLNAGQLHVEDEEQRGRGQGRGQVLHVDKGALALALVPQLGPDRGGSEVRKIQDLFTTFRVFDVDARAARAPADLSSDSEHLRADAGNLAAFLSYLSRATPAVFESLMDDARAMVPGLKDLRFRRVGGPDEFVAVELVDQGLPGATPLSHASFGTIRVLSLLAMLHDPDPPQLTCVEEIDHGLHPHLFDRLVELLRIASRRSQFIIATHSPALVNRLEPDELIVCERDSRTGLARIPAADPHRVAELKRDTGYGLGELWFSGTLGGVPEE